MKMGLAQTVKQKFPMPMAFFSPAIHPYLPTLPTSHFPSPSHPHPHSYIPPPPLPSIPHASYTFVKNSPPSGVKSSELEQSLSLCERGVGDRPVHPWSLFLGGGGGLVPCVSGWERCVRTVKEMCTCCKRYMYVP